MNLSQASSGVMVMAVDYRSLPANHMKVTETPKSFQVGTAWLPELKCRILGILVGLICFTSFKMSKWTVWKDPILRGVNLWSCIGSRPSWKSPSKTIADIYQQRIWAFSDINILYRSLCFLNSVASLEADPVEDWSKQKIEQKHHVGPGTWGDDDMKCSGRGRVKWWWWVLPVYTVVMFLVWSHIDDLDREATRLLFTSTMMY